MNLASLLLISISLTFDSFAVSVTTGLVANTIKFWQATKIALVLAFFQALMPLIGWFIGSHLINITEIYHHWIAFGLLSLIGIKLIYDSLNKKEEHRQFDPFKPGFMIVIAIATSIDALVVGLSFAFVEINIWLSIAIIGFFTYLAVMLGTLFGKKAGKWLGKEVEILGGLILISIGVKILLEQG
jgi:putative Mn2+ efflux pump MntP